MTKGLGRGVSASICWRPAYPPLNHFQSTPSRSRSCRRRGSDSPTHSPTDRQGASADSAIEFDRQTHVNAQQIDFECSEAVERNRQRHVGTEAPSGLRQRVQSPIQKRLRCTSCPRCTLEVFRHCTRGVTASGSPRSGDAGCGVFIGMRPRSPSMHHCTNMTQSLSRSTTSQM